MASITGTGPRPIVVVHSSDLHIDDDARPDGYTGLVGLAAVLETARREVADLILLAGDTFDNGRVSRDIARQAADLLAASTAPVVLLPGNHDPAFDDSMFHRSGIVDVPQARVIGLTAPESLVLDHIGLEITGRPHRSYDDMHPLPEAVPRRCRWRIVVAHGHYVPAQDWTDEAHRSWRISDQALADAGADYVALGHWDRAACVGPDGVQAFYSGSPDLARSVNVVRLAGNGITVERREVLPELAPRWGGR